MFRISFLIFVAHIVAIPSLLIGMESVNARPLSEFISQPDLFEKVLAQVSLEPDDVRIDTGDLAFFGGDKYKLKIVNTFFENPWRISEYTRLMTDQLLKDSSDLVALTVSAHKKLDSGVRLGLIGDPLAISERRIADCGDNALAVALSELDAKFVSQDGYISLNNNAMSTSERENYSTFVNEDYRHIPDPVKEATALFVFTLPEIYKYYALGLLRPCREMGLDVEETARTILDYTVTTFDEEVNISAGEEEENIEDVLLIESLLDKTDWNLLNTGVTLFALTVSKMDSILETSGLSGGKDEFEYAMSTPFGDICLSGRGDQGYLLDNVLLIIDTAGNDMYRTADSDRLTNYPFSVIVDCAGNDDYRSASKMNSTAFLPRPSFGAGFFGYGILLDCSGDDKYNADYASLGFGCFGTGILMDKKGNDRYMGYRNIQGCGNFGTGILSDISGDDTYELYTYGQGFGFTRGCGYLIEGEGNDKYIGMRKNHPNGGPFGSERYIHFAQGAAYGRRADFTDGHSWAGGFGALVDGTGDDSYESEVYSQGTGYWYAVGMCVDKQGNDFHHAGWYSLGGSPHFAIGIMQDDEGDDRYALWQQQGIGNGRDFSIGWFEDSAGNDWYFGGILAFGTGDINGLGFFWDKNGDDVYITKGTCLGQARLESVGGLRDIMLTLGCFVDGGGFDRYLVMPGDTAGSGIPKPVPSEKEWQAYPQFDFASNDRTWVRETEQFQTQGARGCGIDSK